MLFNFMTPITAEIEITTARRKILAQKYCRKADPNSRTLQNLFRNLERSGLLVRKEKNKHNAKYIVPLISATRSFTEAYTALNIDYLNLLHETQTEAIKLGLKNPDLQIDPGKVKQKISEQVTEDLVGKISYKRKNVRVKVTYEVECDSTSGEITYGNLVDVIDVVPSENKPQNIKGQSIIEEFISAGNSLKKQQIEILIQNNFELLAQEYKSEPIVVKRKIKKMPTIGRVTYKALVEFLASR